MDAHPSAELDVVLGGGTVIDGTALAEPIVADVGIVGDSIAAIGDLRATKTNRRIDVTGHVVAPGFVDPHTHVEIALTGDTNDAHAPAAQGVTTVLTSPDGFGWAPLPRDQARELWAATAGIYGPLPDDVRPETVGNGLARQQPLRILQKKNEEVAGLRRERDLLFAPSESAIQRVVEELPGPIEH